MGKGRGAQQLWESFKNGLSAERRRSCISEGRRPCCVTLCNLRMLAVFVQTPADSKAFRLGGQELNVSSHQPQHHLRALAVTPSLVSFTPKESRSSTRKGECFLLPPSNHSEDVGNKRQTCGAERQILLFTLLPPPPLPCRSNLFPHRGLTYLLKSNPPGTLCSGTTFSSNLQGGSVVAGLGDALRRPAAFREKLLEDVGGIH